MFNSGIIDVTLSLVFIYLLLSLVCTAINEVIEGILKKRAATLQKGIRELLNDPDGKGLVKDLYNHPLIYSLFQGDYNPKRTKNLPSYIPSRNFALALMDIVLPAQPDATSGTVASGAAGATTWAAVSAGTKPLQPLREAIGLMTNEKTKRALMTLVDAAGNDISKARENIEGWFDSSMDRAAGWYKRHVQWITLALGLIIAILVNADTISIGTRLSYDVTMRDSLVAATTEYAKTSPVAQSKSPVPNPDSQFAACKKDENSPECKVAQNLNEIKKLGLPIGWKQENIPTTRFDWLSKILGWFLTAFAVSLGAPFWFDTLNKIMIVRATVKPREKSPEEPPIDRVK